MAEAAIKEMLLILAIFYPEFISGYLK